MTGADGKAVMRPAKLIKPIPPHPIQQEEQKTQVGYVDELSLCSQYEKLSKSIADPATPSVQVKIEKGKADMLNFYPQLSKSDQWPKLI